MCQACETYFDDPREQRAAAPRTRRAAQQQQQPAQLPSPTKQSEEAPEECKQQYAKAKQDKDTALCALLLRLCPQLEQPAPQLPNAAQQLHLAEQKAAKARRILQHRKLAVAKHQAQMRELASREEHINDLAGQAELDCAQAEAEAAVALQKWKEANGQTTKADPAPCAEVLGYLDGDQDKAIYEAAIAKIHELAAKAKEKKQAQDAAATQAAAAEAQRQAAEQTAEDKKESEKQRATPPTGTEAAAGAAPPLGAAPMDEDQDLELQTCASTSGGLGCLKGKSKLDMHEAARLTALSAEKLAKRQKTCAASASASKTCG